MTQESLKPEKITDIVYKMDEYLSAMREMEKDEVVKFVDQLEGYVRDYFTAQNLDDLELKKQLVEMVDVLYLLTVNLDRRDIHTDGYFGIVLNRLFWSLQQRNVLAFFILDNSLRDDRFKMVTELFNSAGFNIVAPYSYKELQYSENTTELPALGYKEIEKKIDQSKSEKRHILYVEKDASVNYLKEVLALGEEFQSEYVCIFRNKAPDGNSNATWLLGSFADYLDMQQ
jgi:hypothetical protein